MARSFLAPPSLLAPFQAHLSSLLWALLFTLAPGAWATAAESLRACEETALTYVWLRDHPDGNASRYADLFTEDGVLDLVSRRMQGRAELEAEFRAMPSDVRSVHLLSNVQVFAIDEERARGQSYVSVWFHPADEPLPAVSGAAIVAEYLDEYRIEEGVCRIASKRLVPRFRDAGFRPPQATD